MKYSVIKRKNKIKEAIESDEIRSWCRLEGQNTFTRNRKIPCKDLIYLSLNNKAKTTSIEIRDYEKNLKGNDNVTYTEEAYLKQRRHLNPLVFKRLNNVFLCSFYNETPDEVSTVKGYILLGIDGSKYEIPNTPKNREYFGFQTNQSKDTVPARANTSSVYDLKNKFYCDVTIDTYNSNEKALAKKNIEQTLKIIPNQKKIYIMDRNYVSLEFLLWLNARNLNYIFRLNKSSYKQEVESMNTNDEYISIKHTKERLKKIKKNYPEEAKKLEQLKETKVRVTKATLSNGEEIRILSNLSYDEFNQDDIVNLYSERWGIEKSYDTMKNKLKSESFTGNLPIIIEQDLYAQVLIFNQVQDMINEANIKLKEKNKKTKFEYQININKAIGIFKDEFIKILLIDDKNISRRKYEELVNEMTNYVTAIRLNRPSKPRKFNHSNKYRTNMKPSY